MPRIIPIEIRLARLSSPEAGGCRVWRGKQDRNGYGQITLHDGGRVRGRMAHRVAYEHFVGPIPAPLEVDHLCRNRACINTEHMELVTHAENVRRARLAAVEVVAR